MSLHGRIQHCGAAASILLRLPRQASFSLPGGLQPLLRSLKTIEHPHQPARACRFPTNLEHSGHTVCKLAARGKRLTGTRCKDSLARYRLNLLYRERDLRDPRSIEQLIKAWVEVRIVFQPILMRRNIGVAESPRGGTGHKSALLVYYTGQRHPTSSVSIVALIWIRPAPVA